MKYYCAVVCESPPFSGDETEVGPPNCGAEFCLPLQHVVEVFEISCEERILSNTTNIMSTNVLLEALQIVVDEEDKECRTRFSADFFRTLPTTPIYVETL